MVSDTIDVRISPSPDPSPPAWSRPLIGVSPQAPILDSKSYPLKSDAFHLTLHAVCSESHLRLRIWQPVFSLLD